MRYTPPATMQYRPNARQVRGKSATLNRFLEKKRAAKINTFLIHSRGRVASSKRERMARSARARDGASSSRRCVPVAWTCARVLCDKGDIQHTSSVRRYIPDHWRETTTESVRRR